MKNDKHTHDNENDELTFVKLAAVTANVVRWLLNSDKKQDEDRGDDRRSGNENEKKTEKDSAYVDQRLKELAAFERQAMGLTIKRRKS